MAKPIHYRDTDPEGRTDTASNPPVLLIHGDFSDSGRAWSAQLESLADRYRLLAVDRRGYGTSPVEPRPYTIAGDALDALEVADLAGAPYFHLVGHSYGGVVAIEAARRAPGRVRSLHLIEPPYPALLPEDPDVASFLKRSRDIFRHADEWGYERCTAAFFEMIGGPKLVDLLRSKPVWRQMVKDAGRIATAQPPDEYPAAVLNEFRTGRPSQVYTGGRSNPALRKLARRISEILPDCPLVDIPEAYHDVQRAGASFNRALLSMTDPIGRAAADHATHEPRHPDHGQDAPGRR